MSHLFVTKEDKIKTFWGATLGCKYLINIGAYHILAIDCMTGRLLNVEMYPAIHTFTQNCF